MNPVLVPQLAGDIHGRRENHFGVERLIVVHAPKRFLESTDTLYNVAARQDAARTRDFRGSLEISNQNLGWLRELIERDPEGQLKVTMGISRVAGPAEPPQRVPVEHSGLAMAFEEGDLLVKLVWEPYVICVEQRDESSSGVANTQITRRAAASRDVSRMFQ